MTYNVFSGTLNPAHSLTLKLSIANILLQRWQQCVPHTWSNDAETSVAEAGVSPRYRACPVIW